MLNHLDKEMGCKSSSLVLYSFPSLLLFFFFFKPGARFGLLDFFREFIGCVLELVFGICRVGFELSLVPADGFRVCSILFEA